jgi:hypothetical protein
MQATGPLTFQSLRPIRASRQGAAIILVLLFVVMLAGLIVAFFSRALTERQIANTSGNSSKVDIFAQGAVDQIVGDLQQEIIVGSTGTAAGSGTIYTPNAAANAMPALVGSTGTGGLENLVKVSLSGSAFYSGAGFSTSGTARAVSISSTAASINGRYVSIDRWNKPLFMPVAGSTNTTPVLTSGSFTPPDWILVSRDGSNPTTWSSGLKSSGTSSSGVIGRYAYAIYHEGGLLDANVVGVPFDYNNGYIYSAYVSGSMVSGTKGIVYKTTQGMVDFNFLKGPDGKTLISAPYVGGPLVAWRNWATLSASGSFSKPNIPAASGSSYYSYLVSNTTGFLSVSGTLNSNDSQSDRLFISRQQLIDFVKNGLKCTTATSGSNINVLNYLTTFSRDINQPSFAPFANRPTVLLASKGGNNAAGLSLDDKINPSLLISGSSSFTRNDGTTAQKGEPLLNKRFNLRRLAWLTYKGPSAERDLTVTGTTGSNADIALLKLNGISQEWLEEGTADNIKKYFGLDWNSSGYWQYNVHNGTSGSGPSGSILKLGEIASLSTIHEPDFFEILKATIHVGSLGKALLNSKTAVTAPTGIASAEVPENYYYAKQSSIDYQIIQLGANIIDQYDVDGYPTRIVFNDGSSLGDHEFQGVENLPYLYSVINGIIPTVKASPEQSGTNEITSGTGVLAASGKGVYMQYPILWNPHDVTASMGNPRPENFRTTIDSTTPDNVDTSSSYNKFFVFGSSKSGTASNATVIYSYAADSTSPGSSDYIDTGDGSTLGKEINADTNALTFTVSSSGSALLREPTILWGYGTQSGSLSLSANNSFTDIYSGASYKGFYLGSFPLRWVVSVASGTTTIASAFESGVYLSRASSGVQTGIRDAGYFTYRVQYGSSTSGPWTTYDTKYAQTSDNYGMFNYATNMPGVLAGDWPSLYGNYYNTGGCWACASDPRTSRFGMFLQEARVGDGYDAAINGRPPTAVLYSADGSMSWYTGRLEGWIDRTNGVLETVRPDGNAGFFFSGFNAYATTAQTAGWNIRNTSAPVGHFSGSYVVIHPGMLAQNNTDAYSYLKRFYDDDQSGNGSSSSYYADPDGIVRRAMGAYIPSATSSSPTTSSKTTSALPGADTTVGLPTSRTIALSSSSSITGSAASINTGAPASGNYTYQSQSRPFILNRPFVSVAELGYVFRDTPWRNLDFFTPESGDAALLDVFSLSETPAGSNLVAGKVNLNTRQKPVLRALLTNAYMDEFQAASYKAGNIDSAATSGTISDQIAAALVRYTGSNTLANISELVGKWSSSTAISGPSSASVNLQVSDGFADGKLSYVGFVGGTWDSSNHQPNITNPPSDLTSAFDKAYTSAVGSSTNHNSIIEASKYIQRFHEAPIRALSSIGQTRVWNLMIDVVAQTGRYTQGASSLSQFLVEGEQRYWVHVAIDRVTGKVIDKQIEVVKE